MSKNAHAVLRLDWLESYIKVFDSVGKNSLVWWLGTMFAERIIEEYGFWPFFRVKSSGGCGKSSMLEFLWKLHGKKNFEGFMPDKCTKVGRYRMYSQAHNTPVVIIDPQDSNDIMELKMLFNGRLGRVSGVKDSHSIIDDSDHGFTGGVYVVDDYNILHQEYAIRDRCFTMYMDSSHHSVKGRKLALKLRGITIEELQPFKEFVIENYADIFATFQQKYESAKFLPSSDESCMARMNSNMFLAWYYTFEKYFGGK